MTDLPRRRAALALGAAALAGLPRWAAARESALPVPASLRDAGRQAQAAGEPLLLLVSLPGCPYCELVRRNYLLPMRAEGLRAWQIDVTDTQRTVRDFEERASTGAALAARWKAGFTPTVLFFDARGMELADRLVGMTSLASARHKLSGKG
jgi:thioredoxin-related protein